jgi:acetyl esterase/lipase
MRFMDSRALLDPELVEPLAAIEAATGGGFDLHDIAATRAMTAAMVEAVKAEAPPIQGVSSIDMSVSSPAGDVPIRIYRPDGASDPLPTLIWMHPGGYVIGSIELDDLMARQLAKDVGCAVASVEYRLAPEHPYPAPLEDCHAVLEWLGTNGATLGLDSKKLAVGGSSAGGGLAAGVSLLARERGGVQPCYQVLIYPAINDHNIEQASDTVPENLFWSRANALIGWRAYLSGRQATRDVPSPAAASRASDLTGLPPAFIAVGSLDMFVDDCLDYARRLIAAGVTAELHVYPGAFHAFDAFAPMAQVSRSFVADRNAALRRAFA